MTDLYLHRLVELIGAPATTNADALDSVADRFAETLADGGLIHLYGSGHSVLPCQEAFPRYGSYVGFNPLTDPRAMWHNVLGAGGVRELLWLERTERYVDKFLAHQPLNEGDTSSSTATPVATPPASRPRCTPRSAGSSSSRCPAAQPRPAGQPLVGQAPRRRRRRR